MARKRRGQPRIRTDRKVKQNITASKAVLEYAEQGLDVLPVWCDRGIKCVGVIETELLAPDRVHGGIVNYTAGLNDEGELVLRSRGVGESDVTSKATNKRAARITRDFNRR